MEGSNQKAPTSKFVTEPLAIDFMVMIVTRETPCTLEEAIAFLTDKRPDDV